MDSIIRTLKPGQSARLSGDSACWVQIERSGDGKTLRFVRCTERTQAVFRVARYS